VVQNRVKEKIIDIPGSTPKAASLDGKYFTVRITRSDCGSGARAPDNL
jgi:hypothetical protein